jgi:K+/H+ antiporter YhaU regulatory subunit KhtT
MVAEGLDLFEVSTPPQLAAKKILDSMIREQTGCSVVAIRTERAMEVIPNPTAELPAEGDIVLIGTAEAEQKFLDLYG